MHMSLPLRMSFATIPRCSLINAAIDNQGVFDKPLDNTKPIRAATFWSSMRLSGLNCHCSEFPPNRRQSLCVMVQKQHSPKQRGNDRNRGTYCAHEVRVR